MDAEKAVYVAFTVFVSMPGMAAMISSYGEGASMPLIAIFLFVYGIILVYYIPNPLIAGAVFFILLVVTPFTLVMMKYYRDDGD